MRAGQMDLNGISGATSSRRGKSGGHLSSSLVARRAHTAAVRFMTAICLVVCDETSPGASLRRGSFGRVLT